MKIKSIKDNFLIFWKNLKKNIFGKEQRTVFWKNPNVDNLIYQEPHSCGMVALQEIFSKLTLKKLKESFLFCSEKWPHDGLKKREMNIVLRYLKLYNLMKYKDVSKEYFKLQNLLNKKNKIYMVLVPSHYFVIKNGVVIDNSGSYYYEQRNKIFIHCYWELVH